MSSNLNTEAKLNMRASLLLALLLLVSSPSMAEKPLDTDAAVLKNVATILQIPVNKLKVDATFSKQVVPGDALDIVEIVMAIEDNLKISIDDDELDKSVKSKSVTDLPEKLTIKALQKIVRDIYIRKYQNGISSGKKGAK